MSTRALIGLGSNLGDRKAHLERAIGSLEWVGANVQAVSSYYETRPVGGPSEQPRYLNAACAIETMFEPKELLVFLGILEDVAGRKRKREEPWGPRTLDLDLLLYGEHIINTRELIVPHPRMCFRRFVLAPLTEIAPDDIHPITHKTVSQLLANLDRRPSCVALSGLFGPGVRGHIASKLGGLEVGKDRPPFPDQPAPLDPGASNEAVVEHALRWWSYALDHERWATRLERDQWLVVDDWFDEIYATAYDAMPNEKWPDFRNRFLAARERIIMPTFVVARRFQAQFFRELLPQVVGHTPLVDIPILELDDSDSEAQIVAKVLVMCEATRAG